MIYYPKVFAVCTGANKAISMAYRLKNEYKDKNVYIYKELLHNEFIINELEKDGIKTIDNLDILSKKDILIIRAHGEAKSTYEYLNRKGITYFDATCINVSKIHTLVEDKCKDHKIIIVGKKTHPEVIGTNGWCNNEAIIIENENDYKLLNKKDNYYVVSQTTISYDKVLNLINYLKQNNYKYEFDNTICNYQKLIQASSIELAKNMDIMIIIGGKSSSNTKELYNECSKIVKSYFFNNIKEVYDFIKNEKLTNKTKIGITGGASTSKTQIYEIAHLIEFYIYYINRKKDIEKEMIKFNKSLLNKTDNKIITDSINKFINMNSDGKCIRGCLIDLGYKLSKMDDYSLSLSCAYETFETSILIHDDIIDSSILRRGKPTISYSYNQEYNKYNSNNISNSLALCIGDIGFYYTNELIVNKYKKDKNLPKLLSYYNNIVINTIKGEILDVYLPFVEQYDKKHILDEKDIFKIYELKTSYYTIVGPFILGMILGNSSNKDIKKFESILMSLGIAFQIKDDILGIFSSKDILGKSVSSDIEEFKQTILYSYIKIYKNEYLDDLLKYYGKKDISEKDLKEVQNIMINSGALKYANDKMNELFFKTKNEINLLQINDYVKNVLNGFITYLELREK